jgi:rod shape-determining protein MreC
MIEIGDRVVTSGDGEAFPSDLPVGTVATIDDGVIRVRLFTDESPVEYVQIVDFGLQGIIDEARVAGSPAPESASAAAGGSAAP